MLAVANTALDLLVLELVLEGVGVGVLGLVFLVLLPVRRRPEDDVLADRGRIVRRASAVLSALAELGPRLALGHAGVDDLAVGGEADPSGRLHLLALVIVSEADDGLGAVLVLDGLRGR